MDGADTRTRILEAAARLFHEQGYHATGVATILREAGVNAGSLYNLYPSKEALLEGVLERYTRLLRPVVMDPVEARTADPVERVFALLAQYRAWLEPIGFGMGCPIGNLALETADNLPRVRELVARNFDGWAGVVRGWLEEARGAGRLPRDVDAGELAKFVLTVMEGGVMQSRAERSAAPYDACVAQLRRYFALLEERAAAEREGKGAAASAGPRRGRRAARTPGVPRKGSGR